MTHPINKKQRQVKLINHRDHQYLSNGDSAAYRGTIKISRQLFDNTASVMIHTLPLDKALQLFEDIRTRPHGKQDRFSIRVHATTELVRILRLPNYKQQNYIIHIID